MRCVTPTYGLRLMLRPSSASSTPDRKSLTILTLTILPATILDAGESERTAAAAEAAQAEVRRLTQKFASAGEAVSEQGQALRLAQVTAPASLINIAK
eukprot:3178265-Pyramimonas_sp.AAC.2